MVALCSIAGKSVFGPAIASDGAGGAVAAWVDPRSDSGGIYAQRVSDVNVITAAAGSVGSIEPSCEVLVRDGEDQAFAVSPDPGYEIADVTVDGESEGAV